MSFILKLRGMKSVTWNYFEKKDNLNVSWADADVWLNEKFSLSTKRIWDFSRPLSFSLPFFLFVLSYILFLSKVVFKFSRRYISSLNKISCAFTQTYTTPVYDSVPFTLRLSELQLIIIRSLETANNIYTCIKSILNQLPKGYKTCQVKFTIKKCPSTS